MSATSIALSGMMASSARLLASAANVANIDSAGAIRRIASATSAPSAQAYQPIDTVAISADAADGVAVTYRPRQPGTIAVAAPDSPLADSSGMVAMPNVDPLQEATDQISAQRAYEANIRVVQAETTMQRRLFTMLA